MVHATISDPNLVRHQGGCHCGAVRLQVVASPTITAYQCNCSICVKKQYKFVTVPFSQFKLVKGHDALRTYTLDDAHAAKYNFCTTCGVQVLHLPNDDPETYGVALYCLDEGTIKKVNYTKVDANGQPRRKTSIIEQLSTTMQQVNMRKISATEKPDLKTLEQQQQQLTQKILTNGDNNIDSKKTSPSTSTRKISTGEAVQGKSPQGSNRKISLIDRFDLKSLGQSTRKTSTTSAPASPVSSSSQERSA